MFDIFERQFVQKSKTELISKMGFSLLSFQDQKEIYTISPLTHSSYRLLIKRIYFPSTRNR